ncbi:neural cell adhesion molecule L1.1-like isoform X1 [Xiphophorus couchianus]|uniref:neural cell adhesion molecule L1.1-like isoform X1 n=1 Tax=Xiphophorus couchianus TaxID=32473 RepID=UPI001015D064|nr:neural cell adhesion molecule L1.1-like isoform X1 [Xiphophorus couchianus]XP_027865849.1 neural cell adhesion molecule L1.1-like isoform X1 [Xiphophorus couchianus]XP_027865850.1 neural cell adhesion molecule L1.1-like isoform X1 [Xiphophorus couchianus]XP_027865851.1 neural cell adhesion molecule L1.1-like isoform X1 [Xiphophorus couchianus]
MCAPQCLWMGCRGRCPPVLPLLLLPLYFLFAQGAIIIPEHYNLQLLQTPPKLTVVPRSVTAFSREDIVLTCNATGSPTPLIRWVKDGVQFGPEKSGSGKINASEDEETMELESYAGVYQCFASNDLGTAMTQTVEVIVEPHPVVAKENEVDKSAYESESLILTCNPPKRSTPPYIYWMGTKMRHIPQNERVMIGLDGNLYFANLIKTDSRSDYNCYAQYTAARTIIPVTVARLTVQSSNEVVRGRKPDLLQPHGSHTAVQALRGQSVTLECIPKGLPTPWVEWQKTDGDLKTTSASLDSFDRWLYFDSITEDDDGEYRCRAHNVHGNATHSFTVTVKAAPYWVKEFPELTYAPGETVRLDCLAKGNPEPAITWRINGEPLTAVDEDPRRSVTGSALILRDVVVSDTAIYQCEAANVHGSILQNINLFVVELPPQILSSDGIVYKVFEGEQVSMDCESFGAPRPQITWLREDTVPLLLDNRVSLFTNGTVELVNVTHEDSGAYTCSVDNTDISITANLEVFNQTVILKGPLDVHVRRGQTAYLDCHFYKDPRLRANVQWKKDGQHLNFPMPNKSRYNLHKNHTLQVKKAQQDDTGKFSCEVRTDPVGQVMATGSITVLAPPDPPGSVSLSPIEDYSATLSWIPGSSHNSPITEFIVEAEEKPQTDSGAAAWRNWTTVPGDFSHFQLSLQPFCRYRFRVTAVNKLGRSKASEPTEPRSIPPAAPRSNPTNVRTNSTEPGVLLITWDEMEKRLHNGQDFQYRVYWREADNKNADWNWSYVKSPPFTVNNTGTFTPFEIKVQAVNAIESGPTPEANTGHSGEDKPEEPPTGVAFSVVNSTVTVTWNEAQNVRGHLLGYRLYIRRLGSSSGRDRRSLGKHHHTAERHRLEQHKLANRNNWMVQVDGPKTVTEVTGLRLFSQYELELTAFNSKGESPRSSPTRFNTPEGAPGPPASLRFESPTETSLVLHWTPPHEVNGELQGYEVQYQQEGGSQMEIQMINVFNVNQVELKNLDPSSYYLFKVIARTAAGQGPPITRRGATLLEGAPPTNITVVSSVTSLNLSWVPEDRHRNHGFHIHYLRKSAGGQWEESELINSTQGFYSLMGLQPGTEYSLRILHDNNTHWQEMLRTVGPVPSEMPGRFATQGWLIGLISAIVLLILILLILCLIKRSRGGKYAVKDKEKKEIDFDLQNKDETFGEYRSLESDGDEKRSDSQRSLCDDSKLGSEDSLAEYGDSVDIQFNEDGSFIGQYSGRSAAAAPPGSSGPASPLNPAPPPPFAPSMSGILNRPS